MTTDQIISLVAASLLAFIVRFFNVVLEWLSRVLGVKPPEPIPTAVGPDVAPTPADASGGHTGTNPTTEG